MTASRDAKPSAKYGFTLFIDEAGDDGFETVSPIDPGGSSEYFVMAGVLIRYQRRAELIDHINAIKQSVGLQPSQELHFRDLAADQQLPTIKQLAKFQAGLVAVVSNKRNMREYRNLRVEAKILEQTKRGKIRPQKYNYFYNHTFRYLMERVSAECALRSPSYYGKHMPIEVIFSHRRDFQYSQTQAYMHKLRVSRHDRAYFNNKHQIDWSCFNPSDITSARARAECGLQFADCVASSIFRAVDEDRFGDDVMPEFLEELSPRFLRASGNSTPAGYGFKLLPDPFPGPAQIPLTDRQARSLAAVGYIRPAEMHLPT